MSWRRFPILSSESAAASSRYGARVLGSSAMGRARKAERASPGCMADAAGKAQRRPRPGANFGSGLHYGAQRELRRRAQSVGSDVLDGEGQGLAAARGTPGPLRRSSTMPGVACESTIFGNRGIMVVRRSVRSILVERSAATVGERREGSSLVRRKETESLMSAARSNFAGFGRYRRFHDHVAMPTLR